MSSIISLLRKRVYDHERYRWLKKIRIIKILNGYHKYSSSNILGHILLKTPSASMTQYNGLLSIIPNLHKHIIVIHNREGITRDGIHETHRSN